MSKYRNFTLTLNNYQDKPEIVEAIKALPYKYLVWGEEEGKEGTPHKQGTIIFNSQKTLSAAINCLKGCHVEVCKALFPSIEYCKKDGKYEEYGTPPKTKQAAAAEGGEAEQERWRQIRIACEEGRIDDIPEKIRTRDYRMVEHHRSEGAKRRKLDDTSEKHLWYYGDSGTGKSRKAREENPDAYLKMCNKWWDGYDDEDVVIIEDFDAAHSVLNHHMKIWADRYPFLAEIKGGARKIRPKIVIVTSNYSPEEIWHTDAELDPILRRFKKVNFNKQFPGRASGHTTASAGANTAPGANLEDQMK